MQIFVAPGIVIQGRKKDADRLASLHGSMLIRMQDSLDRGVSSAPTRGRWFARWRRVLRELGGQISDEAIWRFVEGEMRFLRERTTVCIFCWMSLKDYPADLDMQRGVPHLVFCSDRKNPSPTQRRINAMRWELRKRMPPIPPEPVEPYRPPEKIIVAPGIVVSDRKGIKQRIIDLQTEMLREFQACVDQGSSPKTATGFWIDRWATFLQKNVISANFYAIASYVEGEMRRLISPPDGQAAEAIVLPLSSAAYLKRRSVSSTELWDVR